jgi:3-hydroxyacyl-CoA dehydrogenase
MPSERDRALRYVEEASAKLGSVAGIPPCDADDIYLVSVVGAGTMGSGIAIALLDSGLAVTLIDLSAASLESGAARIRKTFESLVARGRMTQSDADARLRRLALSGCLADAASADIVIEAVFEDLAIKRGVFAQLGSVVRPDAILATNTSTLDVDLIADAAAFPGRVVGLHFFSPANIMRLLEVIRGRQTAPSVLGRVMALARRIGKVAVVSGVCDGFIGNRMFEEYLRQAYLLLEEGALPSQIDTAMQAWGFALGPLRVMDLAGNDIGLSIRRRRAVEQPDRPYSVLPDLICAQGRFGQKTKSGWYLYPDGRKPVHDPAVDDLVIAHSAAIGLTRRAVSDEDIQERCVLALINEGARILGEGIAARPWDIDQVWLHGYGMSPDRGGPMFQADEMGLPHVLHRLETRAAGREGWAFRPAPLIRELVSAKTGFESLNR